LDTNIGLDTGLAPTNTKPSSKPKLARLRYAGACVLLKFTAKRQIMI
jgi:hypothetical protein